MRTLLNDLRYGLRILRASSVIRMIVARGLALTGLGLAIGLVAAWVATRAMKNPSTA